MKSIQKVMKRAIQILIISSFFLVALNIVLLILITFNSSQININGKGPWTTAAAVAEALKEENGTLHFDVDMAQTLADNNIWAMLIDNTGTVIWSENLPKDIPQTYTPAEISIISRTYLNDYPTFTEPHTLGLIVLGYPQGSYWKLINNSWTTDFIRYAPRNVLIVLLCNVVLIIIIYTIANTTLLRSINPILDGIQALPAGKSIQVKETGVLTEVAHNINQTSAILQKKDYELKKRDLARANWIAGVSHDIRTPLSMVLGYAEQLEAEVQTSEAKRTATIIKTQSLRIRNLINDLNLASKLEYNMQPTENKVLQPLKLLREVIVAYLNSGLQEQYSLKLTADSTEYCGEIIGDVGLIKRAVTNLIENSIHHNPNGCTITLSVKNLNKVCAITIEDNGIGVTDKKLEKLQNQPHYMLCDSSTTEQRHGLGLLIVQQIMFVHHGEIALDHSSSGGFLVRLTFKLFIL